MGWRLDASGAFVYAGQVNLENCSHARLAIGPNEPSALLHDSVDSGQPKAGALARRLGRIEGLEDVSQMIGGKAAAVVPDPYQHIISPGKDGAFPLDVLVVELHGRSLNIQTSALRHC